jgi:hypothetical protein
MMGSPKISRAVLRNPPLRGEKATDTCQEKDGVRRRRRCVPYWNVAQRVVSGVMHLRTPTIPRRDVIPAKHDASS